MRRVRFLASMAATYWNPPVFIMKTRNCVSGCDRVVLSGLCASRHVMPTWTCVMAGIYGCGILESACFIMKPETTYRGVVRSSFQDYAPAVMSCRRGLVRWWASMAVIPRR